MIVCKSPGEIERMRAANVLVANVLAELAAMVVLHEQELCLRTDHSSVVPADTEQRFARKLRNGRLFDRFLVQIDASGGERTAATCAACRGWCPATGRPTTRTPLRRSSRAKASGRNFAVAYTRWTVGSGAGSSRQ